LNAAYCQSLEVIGDEREGAQEGGKEGGRREVDIKVD